MSGAFGTRVVVVGRCPVCALLYGLVPGSVDAEDGRPGGMALFLPRHERREARGECEGTGRLPSQLRLHAP